VKPIKLRFYVANMAVGAAICLLGTGLATQATASPVYLTLSGVIGNHNTNHDYSDAAGFISAAGLYYGASVSFNFLIDFSRPGSVTYLNNTTQTMTAPYFFDDYLWGSEIRNTDAGYYTVANGFGNSGIEYSESNVGFRDPCCGGDSLTGGSSNSGTSIYGIDSWTVGSHALAYTWAFAKSGLESQYLADVTIVRISDTPANLVSEVPTVYLVLPAMAVFGFAQRKMRKKNLLRLRQSSPANLI
jgi:hypothetical protein